MDISKIASKAYKIMFAFYDASKQNFLKTSWAKHGVKKISLGETEIDWVVRP